MRAPRSGKGILPIFREGDMFLAVLQCRLIEKLPETALNNAAAIVCLLQTLSSAAKLGNRDIVQRKRRYVFAARGFPRARKLSGESTQRYHLSLQIELRSELQIKL